MNDLRKTYVEAINDGLSICLARDASVFVIGEGVPDPKGIFGTTKGLREKYGGKRVLDMPVAENGMTGICIGAAINGLRPVLTHQRIDFSLLAMDQVINNAAKWHFMFGGQQKVPLVIKVTIGMGWGQGPQHSQCLQVLYGHVPGLKVVMPATPYDAKGLMIASIEDDDPVIFIEHRWLHSIWGEVPNDYYQVPLGKARVARGGKDITIVASSYFVLEALKAAQVLESMSISAEVIDLRTMKPLDEELIFQSLAKTRRLLVADPAYRDFGVAAEVIARVAENSSLSLLTAPQRITLPNQYAATSSALTRDYYPNYTDLGNKALMMMDRRERLAREGTADVPDESFTGPF